MIYIYIIIIINLIDFLNSKNIILPFYKLTVGDFSGLKTIDDLINYNIITNISMGTPPQEVAHFIDPTSHNFNFQKKLVTFGNNKFNPFLSQYENLTNFWFQEKQSSTFVENNITGFYSDIYYFNNLNNETIKASNIKYNIIETHKKDEYRCGIIGLNNPSNLDFKLNEKESFFINELKESGLITEYTFFILYEDTNNIFNYNNDNNAYGAIIIGDSPHILNPDKFKKEDLIVNQGKDWSISINNVAFYSPKGDFTQVKIDMQISFISGFIKGTTSYRIKIEEIFFNELIIKNLCKMDVIQENVYLTSYYVFSCENSFEVQYNIKSFPTLYFNLDNNLEFVFSYNDLFKEINNRLYFMIIFKVEAVLNFSPKWVMGEIFLRKYLTLFNYETREISFYKSKVEEINSETLKNAMDYTVLKIICGIILGLILIYIAFLLFRKYIKSKKVAADDLENIDSINKEKGNKNEVLLSNKNN